MLVVRRTDVETACSAVQNVGILLPVAGLGVGVCRSKREASRLPESKSPVGTEVEAVGGLLAPVGPAFSRLCRARASTTPPTISSRTKTPLPLPRASAPLKLRWRWLSASVWCCAYRCRRESKTLSVISPCERSEPERVCKAAGFDGSGCPLPKKWQNKGSTLIYVISLKMGICKCRCPFSAY